ncbi:hypothetical protein DV515_00007588 [Chloebia gouldiae]|uniref:Uncharacterized protein n=1 Tax=Chloebia gouldiae TaxID=44316 RepID=A0A3L8SHR5_CHLGU|nr:hypothetical protein DV515_00007588 [Chloebia gouldiae]
MGATLGSPQPPPAPRGLVFTEEDMSSRQLLLVGYAEQILYYTEENSYTGHRDLGDKIPPELDSSSDPLTVSSPQDQRVVD